MKRQSHACTKCRLEMQTSRYFWKRGFRLPMMVTSWKMQTLSCAFDPSTAGHLTSRSLSWAHEEVAEDVLLLAPSLFLKKTSIYVSFSDSTRAKPPCPSYGFPFFFPAWHRCTVEGQVWSTLQALEKQLAGQLSFLLQPVLLWALQVPHLLPRTRLTPSIRSNTQYVCTSLGFLQLRAINLILCPFPSMKNFTMCTEGIDNQKQDQDRKWPCAQAVWEPNWGRQFLARCFGAALLQVLSKETSSTWNQ